MNDHPDIAAAPPRSAPTTVAALRATILQKLAYQVGKRQIEANEHDWFMATALAVRDRVVDGWMAGIEQAYRLQERRVYYLSLEFLIGRLLFDSLDSLGLTEPVRAALAGLDIDLDRLRQLEPDAALGNGGLGRLAACYMESMASLGIPAHGYGIRYDHGLFRQVIVNGWQHEYPEEWLSAGNPWEFHRPEVVYEIGFGGTVEAVPVAGHSGAPGLAPGREGRGGGLRHPGGGLARQAGEHAAAVVGAPGRPAAARCVQPRRPCRRAERPDPRRGDLARCSTRATRRRPAWNCGCARSISSPPPRCRIWCAAMSRPGGDIRTLADKVAIQLNDTHPADRRRRADAHPGRSARRGLGGSLGDHPGHVLLHQPHAAARGAGKLAGRADGAAAAAPHADHLPDQRAASRPRAPASSGR